MAFETSLRDGVLPGGWLDETRLVFGFENDFARDKGLLMKQRSVDEPEACPILHKLATNFGRPIEAAASDVLGFAGVLNGDKS